MVETSQKLKLADLQIETLKRNITHSQLTDKEINQLPTDTKIYESVGRMFVLKTITEARTNLENKIKNSEEKVKSLEVCNQHFIFMFLKFLTVNYITGNKSLP